MADGINASSEHLPFAFWNEASAKRAVGELSLLREMLGDADTRHMLVGWPRVAASVAREKAMRQGVPADEIVRAQGEIAGYGLAELMLTERIRLGEQAAQYQPKPKQVLRRPKDGLEAAAWRKDGTAAQKLTATAGWDILVRRWADMAWTAAWLKSVCPPEVAPILDAQIKGILCTVQVVQDKIDKLHAAVAWQTEQTAKGSEGD